MSHAIVEVKDLSKSFPKRAINGKGRLWKRIIPFDRRPAERFVAVNGITFQIHEGEIFGLLGPNRAGKTTTIKMLCTLLEPTSGMVMVNGYDAVHQADLVRQNLG